MIKNVVLDLGNVMVRFYPDLYISQFVDRKGEIDYFRRICFGKEWSAGDRGLMSREEIIETICKKYPADAEMIHTIMDNCDETLRASKKNTALLKKLREAGIGVYYLSNVGEQAFEYMKATHEFFNYMDGGIASYQEGLLKPDPAIFELFLTRYGKRAEECVFVDDTPVNAEAAATLGFHSIILKNIDDLTDELKKIDELAKIIEA